MGVNLGVNRVAMGVTLQALTPLLHPHLHPIIKEKYNKNKDILLKPLNFLKSSVYKTENYTQKISTQKTSEYTHLRQDFLNFLSDKKNHYISDIYKKFNANKEILPILINDLVEETEIIVFDSGIIKKLI